MTTIAYRAGVMAADSQASWSGSGIKTRMQKLYRVRGHIIGIAGDVHVASLFTDWFKSGLDSTKPDLLALSSDEDFIALVVTPSKRLLTFSRTLQAIPEEGEFFAVGSGAGPAMAAMYCGASAKRAVEVACKVDLFTSLPVKTMTVRVKK